MKLAHINDQVVEAPEHAIAYKYEDPTDDARWIFDESEVYEIRQVDPSLLVDVLAVGDRVGGGEGPDYDTGRIDDFDGEFAVVSWDSLVVTKSHVGGLVKI